MNSKKVLSVIAVSALSLSLAACGASPKESFISATEKTSELESYQVVSELKFSFDVDKAENVSAEEKANMEKVENGSYSLKQVVDHKAKKYETTFGINYDNKEFSVPVLVNEEEEMIYVDFKNIFSAVPEASVLASQLGDRTTLEIDVKEINAMSSPENQVDLSKTSIRDIEKIVSKEVAAVLELKEDKEFTKEKDGSKVSFSEAEVKHILLSVSSKVQEKSTEKALTDEEKKELEAEINQLFEDVKVNEISSLVTTDKKGNVKTKETVINISPKDESVDASVKLVITDTYSQVGKDVEFSFTPEKKSSFTYMEAMMLMMGGVQ